MILMLVAASVQVVHTGTRHNYYGFTHRAGSLRSNRSEGRGHLFPGQQTEDSISNSHTLSDPVGIHIHGSGQPDWSAGTRDGGVTWPPFNLAAFGLSAGIVAVDDQKNFYLSTSHGAASFEWGIWKSRDNSMTWVLQGNFFDGSHDYVNQVDTFLRTSNGTFLVFGMDSTGKPLVWRSSDNGITWTRLLIADFPMTLGLGTAVEDPIRHGTVILTGEVGGTDSYLIVSRDDGATWNTSINTTRLRFPFWARFSALRTGTCTVEGSWIVVLSRSSPDGYVILRSTDTGATWDTVYDGSRSGLTWGSVAPAVSRVLSGDNAGRLIFLGTKYSDNDGASWKDLASPAGDWSFVAHYASGDSHTAVYASSPMGLYRSLDGGNSWSLSLSTSGSTTDVIGTAMLQFPDPEPEEKTNRQAGRVTRNQERRFGR
jgi:hypothetical protein